MNMNDSRMEPPYGCFLSFVIYQTLLFAIMDIECGYKLPAGLADHFAVVIHAGGAAAVKVDGLNCPSLPMISFSSPMVQLDTFHQKQHAI
jgi:hypothetical protein